MPVKAIRAAPVTGSHQPSANGNWKAYTSGGSPSGAAAVAPREAEVPSPAAM